MNRVDRTVTWLLSVSPARWLAIAFLLQVATFAARPMVSYRALEVGAEPAAIGLIAGSYSLLSLVAVLPLGRLIDRWDAPLFIIGGSAALTLLMAGLIFADSLLALAVIQALLGLAHTTAMLGLQALIANTGDARKRDSSFGSFTAAVSAGQLLGPVSAGLFVSLAAAGDVADSAPGRAGTAAAFAGATAFAALGVLFAAALRSSSSRQVSTQPELGAPRAIPLSEVFRIPDMGHAILVSVTVLATVDIFVAYLPVYGEANGIAVQTVTWLLAARAASSLGSRLFLGQLVNRVGRRRMLVSGMAVPAVCLAILPLATDELLLFVLVAFAGFGLGIGQPLSIIWVAARAPAGVRATALAVRLVGNRLGQVCLPAAAGAIAGAASVSGVFYAMGLMLFVSSAAVWRGTDDLSDADELPLAAGDTSS